MSAPALEALLRSSELTGASAIAAFTLRSKALASSSVLAQRVERTVTLG
ncbi:MAG TPA: hypothetical protein VFG30_23385 [Polyangiales bacterium]|nr:hypothetical protein [Polyangiales bacterium]